MVSCSGSRALYERFYDGFASHGEPNIPFDKAFLRSEPFYTLLARLKQHVEEHQRDHWCPPRHCTQFFCCLHVKHSVQSLSLGNPKEGIRGGSSAPLAIACCAHTHTLCTGH